MERKLNIYFERDILEAFYQVVQKTLNEDKTYEDLHYHLSGLCEITQLLLDNTHRLPGYDNVVKEINRYME